MFDQRIYLIQFDTLVMWHTPSELHDASLRVIRRLMHCLLLLPPFPQVKLKILYTIVLFFYLVFIAHWRFSFNYNVVYDVKNDYVSRAIDLQKFVGLVICHAVITAEVFWKNCTAEIELQLQRIRHCLRVQFGYCVNLERIRFYCNILIGSLIVRVFMFLAMTLYINFVTDDFVLVFYDLYSEVILLTRFTEFTIYSVVIYRFYRDLCDTSEIFIAELERTPYEMSSVRRVLVERLSMLQHLHGLLWNTIRKIEENSKLSLISMMLKFITDTAVLPYWIYVNLSGPTCWAVILCTYTVNQRIFISMSCFLTVCLTELCGKLVEIIVPCLICTYSEQLQRQLRALFHTLSSDRYNSQLNLALLRISSQLGQEKCFFSAGGLFDINNVTLGKVR